MRWLTATKFNFVSLSHVLFLKTTICGDSQTYTDLTDALAYTLTHDGWQLLTALTYFSSCRWKLITRASRHPNKEQRARKVCEQNIWEAGTKKKASWKALNMKIVRKGVGGVKRQEKNAKNWIGSKINPDFIIDKESKMWRNSEKCSTQALRRSV